MIFYFKKIKQLGQKKGKSEDSPASKLLSKFYKVYSMTILDPLLLSACCKFIQYYFRYHMFQQIDNLRKFLTQIQNCVNLLQYLDLDGKNFDELIQLGQLHLSQELFFKHFMSDAQDNSEEEYYQLMVNNPVVMNSIYDILDLFNFFYIRHTESTDIKISRKALKLNMNPAQVTKNIKKEVRELLDQKQRKVILLKLLELNEVNIRIQACRQLLSLKTIKGEKSGQLNWTLNDLTLLANRLFDLYSTQKGTKKEQDISFIILIFCKFYTEVEPQYVEEIISEIGLYQYDILLDILEDSLLFSHSTNEIQSQNQSDLCISSVFLMKKLLQAQMIREQTQKEQNLKRIKNCINNEGENFDETFPPLLVEDLCQNIGIILECFESKGVINDSLLAFRLIKKLADILEGVTYKIPDSNIQEPDEFTNLDNQINKAQNLFMTNSQKNVTGVRSKSPSITQVSIQGIGKPNQTEPEKIDTVIKQLKRIRQHSVSITQEQENSVSTLATDIIKGLESQRRNAIQVLAQEKQNALFLKNQNQGSFTEKGKNIIKPLGDNNTYNASIDKRKVSIEASLPIHQTKNTEGNEKEGQSNSIKDFHSIRSTTRYHLIKLIKEECTIWDKNKKFQIDSNFYTLYQIQHNLFSSQQGLSRILGFLQPDHRFLMILSKANLIQEILYPGQFRIQAEQKEQQKSQEFSKQVGDILLMGQKHSRLDDETINTYNFELFDSEDDKITYNHMFYNIITNVTDVILLKMFIKPKLQNLTPMEIKQRNQITSRNKKSITLSAFLRCIYFSIKKAPNDEIKESAINQAKNIQTFYKISILCKESGFIKSSLGCKFLTICRLIFKHYHKMAIPQLSDAGPSKQSHMKQYLQISNNDDQKGDDSEEGQFATWSSQEQIEIYLVTLMSIQEMVSLLYQGIFKFKLLQKSDIMLLREIVKTIQIILNQINSLEAVDKVFTENAQKIKNQQVEHPGQNLYPHREHISFVVQRILSAEMVNQLSQIFIFPYQNLDEENRKSLNEATSIYAELFANYFSLSQGDYHKEVCTLNTSQLLLNQNQKNQVNQAFISKIMQCCLETNLSMNLIDDLFVKDMLISNGREILYCWSWVYIRRLAFQKNKLIIFVLTLKFINNNNRDEEKDNPYQKKLLLLTNYGIYIIDVQLGNKCSQCHLGSLCTEKYKVEYILVLSTSSMNSSRQKSVQPLRVLNYSQGFNKQQISISNTMSQQTMFSQKQTTNINMIIVFRTLEKGSQFFKILQKLIPNKLSTSDTFLSFIYHCLFCKFKINFLLQKFSIYQITKNCNYYYQNKKLNALIVFQINLATDNIQRLNLGSDQFNSQGSLNNTMDSKRRMSMDSIGESNSFQQQYSQVKDQGQLQFFIGLEQREQIVQKQKLLSFDLVILASDSKFRDEILIIKEKPSAMFRQQQIYSQIQQYYYFKNHLQSIKNIISQDNINYSAIANELSINSDRLYENILKCFEISRINIKCFAKVEFPNISESSVIISVDQNHFPFEKEKMTKISKTKINVIDKGDDYVDIDLKPRIQHQPQSVRQITLTCELSRQLLKNVVQKSIEADQVINKDSLAQQLNDDYTAQLKHIIRQQHFDQPQSRRQLNRKTSIAATTKRRFSKLKDTVAQKIMPKIFKNSRGTLHNIQEDFNDIEEASLHNDEQEIN